MKAIVWTEYGSPDVLQLKEVKKAIPKDNEILIKIFATTVTAGDCEQRSLKLPFLYRLPMRAYVGFKRPTRITILGMDLAGEIEKAGKDVKRFKKGDQVFAATGFVGMGACAEYICMPEEPEEGALAMKPTNMTYEEATCVPNGGLEALCFLRQGNIQSGQKVLINGAGGTIGPFAIQLAKYFGAEVTGVDSTGKLDMLHAIGADSVIDYTQGDFTKSPNNYDFILDLVGKSSISGSVRSLKQNGRYLIANPGPLKMIRGLWTKTTSSKKVIGGNALFKNEDLIFLKELIEEGKIKAVIDRCYPLEQTAEAHRYVESGHKKGNVVITMEHNNIA
ncbi:MAG: NAD(P)-dependent alcohol dehydrogenase [Thermoplasmata archaeon]|nr:MAG: NAD(P)-dependent alcohol dehydrogenase [Thermoplasmata archaeon]